jgi:hypothetical protein
MQLTRSFNRPDSAFAFFDEIPASQGNYPVMGVVQNMFYDHPKEHAWNRSAQQEFTRRQLREFVLHYFMRVSNYFDPEAYVENGQRARSSKWLSWCPDPKPEGRGFGYSQYFYQTANGTIGRVADDQRYRILDLRDVVHSLDWLLARVRIYDFAVKLRLGSVPQLSVAADESSWVAVAPDFICDREHPEPGVIAEYGIGYAFVRNPTPGVLAYGPGEFDAAFKIIRFRLMEAGGIQVRMVFVSNRANAVLRIRLDPLRLMLRVAEWASFGIGTELMKPAERLIADLDIAWEFDPVFGFVSLANQLTGGHAAQDRCISREQLDWAFLLQHFSVHYRAIQGSLVTWRSVPDWTDEARVPEWAKRGTSV